MKELWAIGPTLITDDAGNRQRVTSELTNCLNFHFPNSRGERRRRDAKCGRRERETNCSGTGPIDADPGPCAVLGFDVAAAPRPSLPACYQWPEPCVKIRRIQKFYNSIEALLYLIGIHRCFRVAREYCVPRTGMHGQED
jgi:hypothetical protein